MLTLSHQIAGWPGMSFLPFSTWQTPTHLSGLSSNANFSRKPARTPLGKVSGFSYIVLISLL